MALCYPSSVLWVMGADVLSCCQSGLTNVWFVFCVRCCHSRQTASGLEIKCLLRGSKYSNRHPAWYSLPVMCVLMDILLSSLCSVCDHGSQWLEAYVGGAEVVGQSRRLGMDVQPQHDHTS